jgi:hypothetical protein
VSSVPVGGSPTTDTQQQSGYPLAADLATRRQARSGTRTADEQATDLPFTGFPALQLLAAGTAALLFGVYLSVIGRRRRVDAPPREQ